MSIALMRRAFSFVIIAGLTALALTMSSRIVVHAERPSGLHAYHYRGEPYVYPTSDVKGWITAVAIELVIASWLLARTRKLTQTTGTLALAFTVLCVPAMVTILDAPIYHGDHLLFVMLAALTLGAASFALHLARLAGRRLGWPTASEVEPEVEPEVEVGVVVDVDVPRAQARIVRRDTRDSSADTRSPHPVVDDPR